MSVHSPQPVVFPDVEKLLVGYFTDLLDVPVTTRVPNERPDEWLRVLRTGGARQSLVVDQPQVTFEYWAQTDTAAQDGAALVRAHVGALTGRRVDGHQVQRVGELSGPGNLPDPTSKQSRYTWTVAIGLRGRPL